MTPKLGILAGLEDELGALGRWRTHKRVLAGATGANPRRTRRAIDHMWREGVRLLLSWGVAGGLDPELRPGDLILPEGVVLPDGRACALEADRLEEGQAEEDADPMLIAGAERMVLSAADKAALKTSTGAVAVDMETWLVAKAAHDAAFPALAIRAIADPAERDVPELAADAVGPDGRPRIGAVLAGLSARPGALPGLLRVRRDYRAGLEALREAARTDVLERLVARVPRI
jgi:hypothetical protein